MLKQISRLILFSLFVILLVCGGPARSTWAQTPEDGKPVKPGPDRGPVPVAFLELSSSQGTQVDTPASPLGYLDWDRMVFQTYRDGNWEIYLYKSYPESPLNLTNDDAADVRPRLSHDASRVVFYSDRSSAPDIYSMNIDGSGLRQLTSYARNNYSPDWSPDDRQIVFVSNRDGATSKSPGEIYIMNADGSAQTRLTFGERDNDSPAWSPDGAQIAWVVYDGAYGSLWVMNADGGNPHPLTNMLPYLQHPTWSPDGKKIAFDYDYDGDGWNELIAIDSWGSSPFLLYDAQADLQDVWMADWIGNGASPIFTLVKFVVLEGQLYISSAYIQDLHPEFKYLQTITSTGLDMYPDVQSLDTYMPVSHISPLPAFSPAAGFDLNVSAVDIGPSGVYSVTAQYRLGTQGIWQNLFSYSQYGIDLNYIHHFSEANSPETVYFRSRAKDHAYNCEPWPTEDAVTRTNLFTSLLDGTVHDNRDRPLPNAAVAISPAAWETNLEADTSGNFQAHLKVTGDHQLGASHAGYNPVETSEKYLNADSINHIHLAALDEHLQNGNFESALSGWTISGTLSAKKGNPYSGQYASVLGFDCEGPCLSAPETPYPAGLYSYPSTAVDSSGTTHVIWDRVMYSSRDLQGNWSPIETLGDFGEPRIVKFFKGAITTDNLNTVHVIVNRKEGLYYLQKPESGNWSASEFLGPGRYPGIVVDSKGNVYVIYFDPDKDKILMQKRELSGVWEPPVTINAWSSYGQFSLAIGSNDVLYIVYVDSSYYMYREIRADGSMSKLEFILRTSLPNPNLSRPLQMIVDHKNRPHVMEYVQDVGWVVLNKRWDGTWSPPEPLNNNSILEADAAIDHLDRIHFVIWDYDDNIHYYTAAENERTENFPILVNNPFNEDISFAIDSSNNASIVWQDYYNLYYQTNARSSQDEEISISQVVDLYPDIHQPTLSFMYALDSFANWSQSNFEVLVTEGVTNTQVFASKKRAGWTHAWVDLSPWAGKTVSLSFKLNQAAGEPYVHLSLDNVSVGSWLTPVVTGVTPAQIETDWASTVITVSGENFIATPSIRIGNAALTGVKFVDEHTLRGRLPANLPIGAQDVWVVNPGGQEGILPHGFRTGKAVFLPLLSR